MERMLKENNERILRAITEQFSQLTVANREKGTFPSQPETNPKLEPPLTLLLTLLGRSVIS